MRGLSKASYHRDANTGWEHFTNDAIYRCEDQDDDEDIEETQDLNEQRYDASGGDLEGCDTSNGYDMPRSPYTRSLR